MLESDEEVPGSVQGGHEGPPGWLGTLVGTLGMAFAGLAIAWSARESPGGAAVPPVGAVFSPFADRESPVFTLAWSPDGRTLAACGFSSTVRVWDRDGGAIRTVEGGTEQPRFLMGWSRDGRSLVLGGLEVPVEVWEMGLEVGRSAGRRVTRPDGRLESVRLIADASEGRPIRVRGGADRHSDWLPDSGNLAVSAAFSPDGRSVATSDDDRMIRVRDAATGRLRHAFPVEGRGASCVAFSRDGSKVAAGGGGSMKVWDATSGVLVATLGSPSGGTAVIDFSPDGSSLACARWDGSLRVFDLASGTERMRLAGHDGQVLTLAWSPDGRTLASGGYDAKVRIWDVARPDEMARAD